MNRIVILMLFCSCLFAVQPVIRNDRTRSSDNDKAKVEKAEPEKEDTRDDENNKSNTNNQNIRNDDRKDRFHDADSNSVNDQREDDLQKIKNLNSKYKDLIKKIDKNAKPPKVKKTR